MNSTQVLYHLNNRSPCTRFLNYVHLKKLCNVRPRMFQNEAVWIYGLSTESMYIQQDYTLQCWTYQECKRKPDWDRTTTSSLARLPCIAKNTFENHQQAVILLTVKLSLINIVPILWLNNRLSRATGLKAYYPMLYHRETQATKAEVAVSSSELPGHEMSTPTWWPAVGGCGLLRDSPFQLVHRALPKLSTARLPESPGGVRNRTDSRTY